MKVMAVNGSPRKSWNTATLLEKTLEGAASRGAETESVHLYDLDYKGCTSCFACKMAGNPTRGRCVMKDGLAPILDRISDGDWKTAQKISKKRGWGRPGVSWTPGIDNLEG